MTNKCLVDEYQRPGKKPRMRDIDTERKRVAVCACAGWSALVRARQAWRGHAHCAAGWPRENGSLGRALVTPPAAARRPEAPELGLCKKGTSSGAARTTLPGVASSPDPSPLHAPLGFLRFSNEVPEHPCVSPVSNHVYERRLIEKYIAENGTDPINNQPLSEEQLIDIKVAHPIRPKPPSATSIPAILKALQDEWDAVMLHSFTLRQQLQTTRQELSHALYQHDAACRVIARLTKEVTAAREALATLKPQAGLIVPQAVPSSQPSVVGAGEPMDLGELVGMTQEIIQKLQDKATVLTTERKKVGSCSGGIRGAGRQEGVAELRLTATSLGGFVFQRGKTVPEELVKPEELSKYRQGLQDKATVLTTERKKRGKTVPEELVKPEELSKYRQVASHVGLHSASIPGILALDLCPSDTNKILTGGADKNVVVFDKSSEQILATLKGHTKKVTSVVFHPSQELVFSASPDATIRIWSVPSTSCVQLWDLRKLKNFKTLQLDNNFEVKSLIFDQSGTYLALGGTDVQIYICKQWTEILHFTEHSGLTTGVAFGHHAKFLASTGMDRSLKFYSL
ncbi:Pre-mRNA-processing factor 19 [Heterocephalus glaber]|uniref:Pre-mRNA-processing factor 19 n=1 Tax=Heterocephalus glaber TaxID=10181 RepID=G5AYE3_HETGA|nr:Pre-mRNA-processing factor 19 [Heterocephalus glaber]